MSFIRDLIEHAKWAEGVRNFPYQDTVGKTTIGIGRNLDDVGISDDEADYLLSNDLRRAVEGARSFPFYKSLDDARQKVIIDMVFNMGVRRVRGFINMIRALEVHDYETAADEMVDSRWYRQTKRRARLLVYVMREGVWPTSLDQF